VRAGSEGVQAPRPPPEGEVGNPYRVYHPLVYAPVDEPELIEWANSVYKSKLNALGKACEEGDWYGYVFFHERPYRFETLAEAGFSCSGPEFVQLVRDVWIDSENIWQFEDEWRDLLPTGAGWQEYIMDPAERSVFAALPDPVRVFRGFAIDGRDRGLSWTTSRDRAA
jgi:hypothetical protein